MKDIERFSVQCIQATKHPGNHATKQTSIQTTRFNWFLLPWGGLPVKGIPNYKDSNKSALDKDSKSTSGHEKYASIFFRRSEKIKNQFLDSGSTFSISVMNLSISIFSTFFEKYFRKLSTKKIVENISTKYFRRKKWQNISDKNIWRKFSDGNIST